jgi:hypothetical protein
MRFYIAETSKEVPHVSLRFIVKDEVKTAYSNVARVTHSFNDFTIDFGEVSPDQPSVAVVHTRIAMSPQQLREFANMLQDTVEAYEANFGKIPTPPKPKSVKP